MKTFKLFSMAALALAMAACSNEDSALENAAPAQQQGTMHFTATIAAPSGDATTRTAYTEDGTTINVKWEVGDKIALVHNGVVDEAEVKTVDDVTGKATIEADFTGNPKDNDDVYLAYPADAVYSAENHDPFPFTPNPVIFDNVKNNQDGTLAYIQDNLDLRMGSGKLAVSGSDVSLKGSVSVPSLICIWKLTLQDESSNPLSATKLTFKNNDDTQAGTKSTGGKSEYYLCVVPSFIPDASGTFSFEATVGGDTYIFWKTGLSLTAGKYYQSTVKMTKGVIWHSSDISSINLNFEEGSREIRGITFACDGNGALYGSYLYSMSGDISFTSSKGNIKKIEINHSGYGSWYGAEGFDGWPSDYDAEGGTFTWEGTPVETVKLPENTGWGQIEGITSIVFTLE